jgi:Domain of unknown function (DUF4158)
MLRHYTLSSEDLALINRRRGDPNRLGFALMLCYLRFPGRILQQGEQPPAALCAFVAEQLGLEPQSWVTYQKSIRNHVLLTRSLFWRRYSAQVAWARLCSNTDFCSFAILTASQNEASIWASSAPIAARNTPRSRCSSAHQPRSPDLSTNVSASLIAPRASKVQSERCKASPFRIRFLVMHSRNRRNCRNLIKYDSRRDSCGPKCLLLA